jgi:tetratricopeptide (TPR) repeat protein/peptidoglycan/LPS O-acetylase OafA/YrhL
MLDNLIRKLPWHVTITIAGMGIFIYANTITTGFIWEEDDFILENPYLRSIKNISFFFEPQYWLKDSQLFRGVFRPLVEVFFTFGINIWGLNPIPFHMANLILHILNSLLFYLIIMKITKDRFVSFLCGVLFVSHPIHSEAVAWIKNLSELMVFFFIFVSMYMWINVISTSGNNSYRGIGIWIWLTFSTFVFALALISNEISITLPLVFSIYIICFVPREKWKRSFFYTIPVYGLAICLGLFWVFLLNERKALDLFSLKGFISSPFLFFNTISKYITLILFPIKLNACHSIRQGFDFKDMGLWLRATAIVFFIAILFLSFRKSRFFFFATSLLLLTLIPISIIHYIGGGSIAEHRLYIPSAGFCIALSGGITYLYKRPWRRISPILAQKMVISFLAILICMYSFKNISRNVVITNEVSLGEDTIRKSPDLVRPRIFLARAYIKRGEISKAREQLEMAIALNPEEPEIYFHMGNIYHIAGEMKKAMESFEEALKFKPDYIRAMTNLAILNAKMGDREKALFLLTKALSIEPDDPAINMNIGVLYGNSGDLDKAISSFEKALKIDPKNIKTISNLAYALIQKGDLNLAIEKYKEALSIEPENKEILLDLGTAFIKKGMLHEAMERFNKVKKIDPGDPRAYNNIGIIYAKLGRYRDAIKEFLAFVKLQPESPIAYKNLGRAFLDAGEYEHAVQAFSKVIAMEPENGKYHYYLGLAKRGKGDIEGARESFEKARRLGFYFDSAIFKGDKE